VWSSDATRCQPAAHNNIINVFLTVSKLHSQLFTAIAFVNINRCDTADVITILTEEQAERILHQVAKTVTAAVCCLQR